MEEIRTEEAPTYSSKLTTISQAIEHDGVVYVSGQLGVDPETEEVVSDDAKEQTEQVFENLEAILEAAGTSLDKTLKTLVMLSDMEYYEGVNEAYGEYLTHPYPARSAVAVGELAMDGAHVEIELVAAVE